MAVINGTTGNDMLASTDEVDIINGLEGDDTILGGIGADTLNGDSGNDTFGFNAVRSSFGSAPRGGINGGFGFDIINSSNVSPVIYAGLDSTSFLLRVGTQEFSVTGVERIVAGSGADSISLGTHQPGVEIFGGSGNDSISGGSGNDILHGEAGNDRFTFTGGGSDQIFGGDGDDIVENFQRGATGSTVDGGAGTDLLIYTDPSAMVNLETGTASGFNAGSFTITSIENVTVMALEVRKG
jgi:serralysin